MVTGNGTEMLASKGGQNFGQLKRLHHLCMSPPLPETPFHWRWNHAESKTNSPRTAQQLMSESFCLDRHLLNPKLGFEEWGAAGSSTRPGSKPWVPNPGSNPSAYHHHHRRATSHVGHCWQSRDRNSWGTGAPPAAPHCPAAWPEKWFLNTVTKSYY